MFTNAVAHSASSGDALMETEFGATNDASFLQTEVARADRFLVPWLEWGVLRMRGSYDERTRDEAGDRR